MITLLIIFVVVYKKKKMITIDSLKEEDIKPIIILEETHFAESLGEKLLSDMINNDVAKALTAKIDKKVIGYISYLYYDTVLEVLNFVVDDSYQRQGVGSSLFNEMILRSPNALTITLEVRPSNIKGRSFYEKNGFKQILIRKNYYTNGEDALVLLKEINA